MDNKPLLIFGYTDYYPGGGLNDLVARAASCEEACDIIKGRYESFDEDRFHILDMTTGKRLSVNVEYNSREMKVVCVRIVVEE